MSNTKNSSARVIGPPSRRAVLAGSAALGLSAKSAWAWNPTANPNVVRAAEGRLAFRVTSTQENAGYDDWRLLVHPDGSRTLESTFLNNDQNWKSVRSIVHRIDVRGRPIECYIVYYKNGDRLGSGWFHVEGETLYAVAGSPNGRLTHELSVPDWVSIVSHAPCTEGWHFWGFDENGPARQTMTLYNLQPYAENTGSVLGRIQSRDVERLETGVIETEAGRFDGTFWAFGTAAKIWTATEDHLPVKMLFEGVDREVELTHYTTYT